MSPLASGILRGTRAAVAMTFDEGTENGDNVICRSIRSKCLRVQDGNDAFPANLLMLILKKRMLLVKCNFLRQIYFVAFKAPPKTIYKEVICVCKMLLFNV